MSYAAGLVGAGMISELHAQAYKDTPGIQLEAIADVDPETLESTADEWEIPTDQRYADHAEMLESEALDVVSVATPTLYHRDHTIAAARIGDPDLIWCEKPIATSVTEAREMTDVAEETDTELLINHVRRWARPYVKLKDAMVEEGILGEIQSCNSQAKLELLRNGTHWVDTLYWLLEERTVEVGGYLNGVAGFDSATPTQDTQDVGGGGYLVTEDGTFLTLDCTVPRESYSGWFFITGSEGRLYINESDRTASYWSIEGGEHDPTPVGIFDKDWGGWPSAFANVAGSIVDVLDGKAENRCPGEEVTHVQEVLVAMFVSHYTDTTVQLPLDRPLRDVSIASW